jgi:hypothetical protein
MATEQILTSQINGYSAGGRVETKIISLSGGSSNQSTGAFSFVVGPVMIELVMDNNDNGSTVYTVLLANMRSFSGVKTADVSGRVARGPGNGGFMKMAVDKSSFGTTLSIGQINVGTEANPSGVGGTASYASYNWPSNARLRVTAWEDTQS